ncbi:flavodoxin domain-containing protein [Reinekea marinisedimentorum]|uniref:Flavodoxin n=1 Tax=Reinekea marinisedimentorum TaxID=230495 RepID=A0A4R3I7X0_9GAMM|nr:flavodoxin domain-containing protein [Reinekea marinisedimentorum]TCS41312.1 flavodoxin I [Reinekea marinisedimentorum]
MAKIGVFVGTAGGTSMKVVDALVNEFEIDESDIINMEDDFGELDDLLEYDVLFLGSSTWGQGDPHFSWVDALLDMETGEFDFSGKKVAFFGAGDCKKHAENFCSALGKLYKSFTGAGASAVGFVPKSLYNYEFSLAEVGEQWCGCGIDEINEADKTEQRINEWIGAVKGSLTA